MDFSKMTSFQGLEEKMRIASQRQKILAQNIANANTPGYKSKDLKVDFSEVLKGKSASSSMAMAVTHPGHIQPAKQSTNYKIQEVSTAETSPDGNNVVLEEEVLKMQQNNMDYQTTTELYKKMSGLLSTALGPR